MCILLTGSPLRFTNWTFCKLWATARWYLQIITATVTNPTQGHQQFHLISSLPLWLLSPKQTECYRSLQIFIFFFYIWESKSHTDKSSGLETACLRFSLLSAGLRHKNLLQPSHCQSYEKTAKAGPHRTCGSHTRVLVPLGFLVSKGTKINIELVSAAEVRKRFFKALLVLQPLQEGPLSPPRHSLKDTPVHPPSFKQGVEFL